MLTLLFMISNLFAQNCRYEINNATFNAVVDEDIQSIRYDFQIRRRSNNFRCLFARVYFSTGNANNYQRKASLAADQIDYNLYREQSLDNVLKDFGDAAGAESLVVFLPQNNVFYTASLYVRVESLESVFNKPVGRYSDQVQASVYNISLIGGGDRFQTNFNIFLNFDLNQFLELSVGPDGFSHDPTSTNFNLNLGTLTTNLIASAGLNVKGNVGYSIFLASLNGSKLVGSSDQIDYQVRIGSSGSFQSLGVANQDYLIFNSSLGTSFNAQAFSLFFRVGTVGSTVEAGVYTDSLTVSVVAN